MCSGVSAADMLCLFMFSKAIMNFDQTLGFFTPTSIKASRCLLGGLHVGLLHTCLQYATTEGSVGTLLFISAHERFYESQLGLATSSSFSVFCPLLRCQNSCL